MRVQMDRQHAEETHWQFCLIPAARHPRIKFRLALQLSPLRGSRPKSTGASPRQCTQSAPDFIQIGSLSAELYNALTSPKRAVKCIQHSTETYSFEPNNQHREIEGTCTESRQQQVGKSLTVRLLMQHVTNSHGESRTCG